MKVFLHEITDLETELDFNEEESWVATSVAKLDEVLDGESRFSPGSPSKKRAISASFSLRKVDEVVVITGKIQTAIQLVCSRCAATFPFKPQPHFSALFCKDPVMAGVGHLATTRGQDDTMITKPAGQNKGFARHAHDYSTDEDESSGKDLDITYISEDYIDLADVLTEQLRFQVPFQPLCKTECKGMCSQCGADLNLGRCACAKLTTTRPFSVLKDLKI